MMMETILSRSLRLMFSGSMALGIGMLAQPAFAQQADSTTIDTSAPVQRVEITGSAIKRIAKEGALPVQVLTQADIKKTGATSVTDLIQNLPAMQGFTTASASVNGGGGGATSAALHSLSAQYTLVLLDGVRMAPQGGSVNLESIPLDAIERVEILTDGASALYGSDAIAGVVNFILKKNKTDGDAYITAQDPQHPGGRSWSAGVSKGFGDLNKDNYNVLLSYSHDDQKQLEATQRSFSAKGGLIPFTANGKNYVFNQTSINSPIANLSIVSAAPSDINGTNATSATLNPYALANAGSCGSNPNSYAHGSTCRFNYAATVQDIPSSVRDSGLAKATFKIDENTTAWATMMVSRYAMTAQYAASAQPFAINSTNLAGVNSTAYQNLFTTYVQPYLTQTGTVITGKNGGGVTAYYRTVAMGGRTDDYQTDAHHFSAGISTAVAGWDLNGVVTLSNSVLKDTAAGGYGNFNEFNALVASGAYDPVMNTGGASLQAAEITGQLLNKTTSNDNTIKVGAQHDLFELPGGSSIISLGADFQHTSLQESYNPLQLANSGYASAPAGTNAQLGGSTAQVPFDASRNNEGLYGEWLLPVTKTLEGNVAARYDSYSKVYSGYVFQTPALGGAQLPNADLGNTFSKATYKLSLRFTPTDAVLLRASYGTGFKAPSLGDIAATSTYAGTTAGSYTCPFNTPASCANGSVPGTPPAQANPVQYDLLSGGNANSGSGGLKAENSKQWTVGFRVEPGFGLTAGLDLWDVQIKDQVLGAGVPEQTGFANPTLYSSLFVNPYQDPVGHYTTIGFNQVPLNGGVANYQGIDWDFAEKLKTPVGPLSLAWNGTYMMKQNYTFQQNGPVLTDLGTFGPDNSVVFRVQMRAVASLTTGNFTNNLSANYKSGYHDEFYGANTGAVKVVNADGSMTAVDYTGHVGSYTTFDWQGRYDYSKALNFTAGIKNLFDKNPPLSLVNAGGGNQVGYDGRYADPLGRAFYLTGHYHF
ncbi:TonB-dependent receptor domain-containing protein [Solimicrobium silvestre]|uniref:TonB-dependent Receptor Plug Domain n=1 Tax=Solimicrobium silvestre TaxID=2099400 RepID=A0A2S9GZM5_9BURK|nr:TonB-dependent receptor [Solimicrobium silvestre]PRC93189.1 TonB-dependent Receptor Plug Domain [Solimicrobium silvestre]